MVRVAENQARVILIAVFAHHEYPAAPRKPGSVPGFPGPIVFEDLAAGKACALRAVYLEHEATVPYLGSLRMAQARDWSDFQKAVAGHHCPSLNMVYADVEGNIGWIGAAPAPARPNSIAPVSQGIPAALTTGISSNYGSAANIFRSCTAAHGSKGRPRRHFDSRLSPKDEQARRDTSACARSGEVWQFKVGVGAGRVPAPLLSLLGGCRSR